MKPPKCLDCRNDAVKLLVCKLKKRYGLCKEHADEVLAWGILVKLMKKK